MIAEQNNICIFCDNFILKGEEYSNEFGCNHCKHIVVNMIEDNNLLNEDLDFNEYLKVNNIHLEERIITDDDITY